MKILIYKTPLYSIAELKEQAEESIHGETFTAAQKEQYHLYGD